MKFFKIYAIEHIASNKLILCLLESLVSLVALDNMRDYICFSLPSHLARLLALGGNDHLSRCKGGT